MNEMEAHTKMLILLFFGMLLMDSFEAHTKCGDPAGPLHCLVVIIFYYQRRKLLYLVCYYFYY